MFSYVYTLLHGITTAHSKDKYLYQLRENHFLNSLLLGDKLCDSLHTCLNAAGRKQCNCHKGADT